LRRCISYTDDVYTWHAARPQDFWTAELGFSPEDFERVKRFGSWATGARKKAAAEAAAAVASTGAAVTAAGEGGGGGGNAEGGGEGEGEEEEDDSRLLEAWEMVEFGRQCKRLIDAGRLAYVRAQLPHLAQGARLVTYCEEEISPENCLLIAAA
jgi:tRNA:m4X modification enzyme